MNRALTNISCVATWLVLITALTVAPSSALACGMPFPMGTEVLAILVGLVLTPVVFGFLIFGVLAHLFR